MLEILVNRCPLADVGGLVLLCMTSRNRISDRLTTQAGINDTPPHYSITPLPQPMPADAADKALVARIRCRETKRPGSSASTALKDG